MVWPQVLSASADLQFVDDQKVVVPLLVASRFPSVSAMTKKEDLGLTDRICHARRNDE
jgi:hypothetical protein